MSSLNKQLIIGNLGADPEVRQFQNGNGVTNISIATSEKYTNKQGEKVEETEWFRVAMFGKLGEIAAQYLRKGSKVYIEGKTKTEKYTDKNGIERYSTSVIASSMTMLGEANPSNSQGNGGQYGSNNQSAQQPRNNNQTRQQRPVQPPQNTQQPEDDDIPF